MGGLLGEMTFAGSAQAAGLLCEGARAATPLCVEFAQALKARVGAESAQEKVRDVANPPWSQAELSVIDQKFDDALKHFNDEYYGDAATEFDAASVAYTSLIDALAKDIAAGDERARQAIAARDFEAAIEEFGKLINWVPDGPYQALQESARAAITDRELIESAREALETNEQLEAEALLSKLATREYEPEATQLRKRIAEERRTARSANLISSGYAALDKGDFDAADRAFQAALAVTANDAGAVNGLKESAERRRSIESQVARTQLEDALHEERWADAGKSADALAKLDQAFDPDRLVRDRLARLAELEAQLDFHLAHPERHSSKNVRAEIDRLLKADYQADLPGARIDAKIAQLRALFANSLSEHDLLLKSDGKTSVRIVPGRDLGMFKELRIRVLSGQYRLVGRRPGYRETVTTIMMPQASGLPTVTIIADERF